MLTQAESYHYQDQLGKLYSFKEEKARYRKSYINWDKIKRANQKIKPIRQKSFFLTDKAGRLLSIIVAKLQKGERVLLNHKYISTFTFVERRQNVRIIEELADILDITYHNSITVDGKNYRYSYEFNFKHHTIQEPKKQLNSASSKHSVGTFMSQQNDPLYIYNKNKDIEDIDLKSNFLQNSERIKTAPIETVKFKKRVPNERKKRTNAEKKARIYHFNQYKEPQNLKHHYPLNKDDNTKLQSLSGRDFSINAMNEILLDMSKRVDRTFCSKAQFISYFGKCLRFEKRDAVKINNINFRIRANITEEERQHAKRESFLSRAECKAHDLENRTTNGFQRLSALGILDKLIN